MLRRVLTSHSQISASATSGAIRHIGGCAPVLYFAGSGQTKQAPDAQVRKNTAIAIEMIKRFKGPAPAPYTRKYKQTVEQIQSEIDALVGGGASKLRRKVTDDQPMDKLTLVERCLRHGLSMYLKDEGKANLSEVGKWLVYTPHDESKLAQLKRDQELKAKAAQLRQKRIEGGGSQTQLPAINWAQEYANSIDREIVAEKRFRYDALAINTTERDEKAVEAVLEQYRRPVQDKRLDELVEMLEKFKPVLAREAIMQRLTIKHLEGQLGVWRYMDWNPEVRDRAELEADNYAYQWWLEFEEKRLLGIRLRSLNESKHNAEKVQGAEIAKQEAAKIAAGGSVTASGSEGHAARDKLLREVLALQARVGKRDEETKDEPKKDKKAAGHH